MKGFPGQPPTTDDVGDQPTPRTDAERRPGVRRRTALGAVGTAALAFTAGCLDSARALTGGRVPIEPEPPGDEPTGSPSEFYYLLEDDSIFEDGGLLEDDETFDESPISVEDLYHDTGDDDLILFYESSAPDHSTSDEEIAFVFSVFREGVVAPGGEINHLYTEVVDGFDGQVEGWGANAKWAQNQLDGNYTSEEVWKRLVNTMIYPEGQERFDSDPNDSDLDGTELPEDNQTEDSTTQSDLDAIDGEQNTTEDEE